MSYHKIEDLQKMVENLKSQEEILKKFDDSICNLNLIDRKVKEIEKNIVEQLFNNHLKINQLIPPRFVGLPYYPFLKGIFTTYIIKDKIEDKIIFKIKDQDACKRILKVLNENQEVIK